MTHLRPMRSLAVLACVAVAATIAPPSASGDEVPGALPWLRVEHVPGERARIVDEWGRTVILRGVNVTGLEDDAYTLTPGADWTDPFWPIDPSAYDGACPQNSHLIKDPPLCQVDAGAGRYEQSAAFDSQNDFAQIRALGFNMVRLTLSWSLLEPQPGDYSQTYVDRIEQVVGWAREQGIYVLLDMHQDNYSRFIPPDDAPEVPPLLTKVPCEGHHCDGAPPWAVLTDGQPGLALLGQAPFDAKMEAAFTSFWLNRTVPGPQGDAPGTGLQDHYVGAMAALAKRFEDDSTVAGYEIMNEPLPGYIPFPGPFDQGFLYPFYRRAIEAITEDVGDDRHLIFFEPMAARNLVDVSVQVSAPFSTYPNLVYAPHVYSHVFTLPGFPLTPDQAFQTADAEARAMGAALFIGEFGNDPSGDDVLLSNATAAHDRHMLGSAAWAWKVNCSGSGPRCTDWSVFYGDTAEPPAQNLEVIPTRQKYLSRVYPRAVSGELLAFGYDPETKSFSMSVTAGPGDTTLNTVVYVPPSVPGTVAVTGSAVLDQVVTNPDGSRLVEVTPTGQGTYGVAIT